MLARHTVNMKRVAMILAAGQGLSNPITLEAVKAADRFVTWCMDRAMDASSLYIGGEFVVQQNRIVSFLVTRGAVPFTAGDIQREFPGLNPRDRDQLIRALGDSGRIKSSGEPGSFLLVR